MKVTIHGNLKKRMMSYKASGGRVQHMMNKIVIVNDANFNVQSGGHTRILNKGHREVVAHLKGELVEIKNTTINPFLNDPNYIKVSYDPKKYPERNYFYNVEDGTPIKFVGTAYAVVTNNSQSRTKLNTYIKRSMNNE